MGGASYLFRDVNLPQTSIYDAISQIARASNSTVAADDRTVVVEPRDVAVQEVACIDKVVLDAKNYTSKPLTNIMDDVWRRTNDMLFETSRWGIVVSYPHVVTNLSISMPTTNALEVFKLVAKSIKADVTFDGYSLDILLPHENTEVASLLRDTQIDDLSIPAGTRFYDGMESLRHQINLRSANNGGESVKFEYCGAQTNLPMAAVHLANMSAFEAVSNICRLSRRNFSCCATSRTVSIGPDGEGYADVLRHLAFQGGRFSGNTGSDAFAALLSAINANLEQNDLLPVGASLSGLPVMERPLCIDIKPCTTWEAFEQFASFANYKVEWNHLRVCFRAADGESVTGTRE